MADGLTSNNPTSDTSSGLPVSSKGKGKAVDETPMTDATMEDDDDSSEEESAAEEQAPEIEEEDEDNMEEIDLDNIVDSRTRGKQIDYAKAAEKAKEDGEELDDDDEEDDEDFDGGDDDAMQE